MPSSALARGRPPAPAWLSLPRRPWWWRHWRVLIRGHLIRGQPPELVFPAASTITKTLDFKTTYTARLSDGTIYTVRLAQSGGKSYITLSGACGEPVFSDSDKATTTALAAAQAAADKAKADVPVFNKKHSPWVYELSEWTAKNLTKKRSEMMEAPRPADEENPEGPGAGSGMPGAGSGMPGAAPGMFPAPGALAPSIAPAGPKPGAAPARGAAKAGAAAKMNPAPSPAKTKPAPSPAPTKTTTKPKPTTTAR